MDCKEKVTIQGFVYIDENGNGTHDVVEKGIKKMSLDLKNSKDITVLTTETKDTGFYAFDVCKDDYKIIPNYTEGEKSYLDINEITILSTNDVTKSFDFKVLKENSLDISLIFLFFTFLIGLCGIWFVKKVIKKS